MRRASILAAVLAAAGGLLLADVAVAQSDPRLLSWPGRGEAPSHPAEAVAPNASSRRPNPVIPHGGFNAPQPASRGLTPAPGPARRTLTPANAWLHPAAPQPAPAPTPAPPPMSATPAPPPPRPATTPPVAEYLPDQGGRGQPAPADLVYPGAPPPAETAPVDPMAPRRDAPIFRLQQAIPPPPQPEAATAAAAVRSEPQATQPQPRVVEVMASGEPAPRAAGGRYYSVHRQNGRDPDPLAIPEPTYVDGLVVGEIETLASQDLAAPQEGPTLIRDRNGNLRAAPAASDGDHQ